MDNFKVIMKCELGTQDRNQPIIEFNSNNVTSDFYKLCRECAFSRSNLYDESLLIYLAALYYFVYYVLVI